MASLPNAAVAKPTARRQKIETKRVEQNNRRHVTFSKRKLGLSNKVTELSILTQAETALIVFSQNGKLYSCSQPDPDAVIRRYLSGGPPQQRHVHASKHPEVETLRQQYKASQNRLKEEKKKLVAIREAQRGGCCCPPWWNQPIEKIDLADLEQFKASIEQLNQNLVAAGDQMRLNSQPQMPLSLAPMPEFSYLSLLNAYVNEDPAWGWTGSGGCSTSTVPEGGFGHY